MNTQLTEYIASHIRSTTAMIRGAEFFFSLGVPEFKNLDDISCSRSENLYPSATFNFRDAEGYEDCISWFRSQSWELTVSENNYENSTMLKSCYLRCDEPRFQVSIYLWQPMPSSDDDIPF